MVWTAIVMLVLLTGMPAKAEELPRLDIEAMCRAAPRLEATDQNTDQNCVRDETQARDQLEQQWTSFDARQRNMCIQETNVGGSPSYVDVLTCIQIAAGNLTPAPNQRPRRNR